MHAKLSGLRAIDLFSISNIRHVQIMDCVRTINNCSLYLYPRRTESVTFQFGSLQGMAVEGKKDAKQNRTQNYLLEWPKMLLPLSG